MKTRRVTTKLGHILRRTSEETIADTASSAPTTCLFPVLSINSISLDESRVSQGLVQNDNGSALE